MSKVIQNRDLCTDVLNPELFVLSATLPTKVHHAIGVFKSFSQAINTFFIPHVVKTLRDICPFIRRMLLLVLALSFRSLNPPLIILPKDVSFSCKVTNMLLYRTQPLFFQF